jgi:hypothetical protein
MEEFNSIKVYAACSHSHLNSQSMVVLERLEENNIKRL